MPQLTPIIPINDEIPSKNNNPTGFQTYTSIFRGIMITSIFNKTAVGTLNPVLSFVMGFNQQPPSLFNVGDFFYSDRPMSSVQIYNGLATRSLVITGFFFDGIIRP